MGRMISIEEFEQQMMYGSTSDAFVFGLGHVQWMPAFMLSPRGESSITPHNLHRANHYSSLYLLPKKEFTVNADNSEYIRALEEEIMDLVTDGNSFWNVSGTGIVYGLPPNSDVSVNIDNLGRVTIALSSSTRSISETISIESFLRQIIITNPPTRTRTEQPLTVEFYNESRVAVKSDSIDLAYYAGKLKRINELMAGMKYPFEGIERRMDFYNMTSRLGLTYSPYIMRYPKPVGKDDGNYWGTCNPAHVTALLQAVGTSTRLYLTHDFTGWNRSNDMRSLKDERYIFHDKTNKFYTRRGVNDMTTASGLSFGSIVIPVTKLNGGKPVHDPISSFWGHVGYYLLGIGASYTDERGTTWDVNSKGEIIGLAPIAGIAPTPGKIGGAGKSVVKNARKLFGKEVAKTTNRIGRDGKAIELIFKDGSKIDINAIRVKQWTPNRHPKAPPGKLQRVKFKNFLPGSKGYKRTPTQNELDLLNNL